MCLYPELGINPKYKSNKKNGGIIPAIPDLRVKYVPRKCGNCIECRKSIARDWYIRLCEDIKFNKEAQFITLTFSDENYSKLAEEFEDLKGYALDNAICTLAVRRFLERYRKENSRSIRHWFVTELGHGKTEHVHIHGIVYGNQYEIGKHWKYGYLWFGKYVNNKTIKYISKYLTKIDPLHKTYTSIRLASPGIGEGYIKSARAKEHKFKGKETRDFYRTAEGYKLPLPTYYRNKLWTDEEREKLWLYKLDENKRYVMGEKIDADDDKYYDLVKFYRKLNRDLGYLDGVKTWDQVEYEERRRIIIQESKIKAGKAKRSEAVILKRTQKDKKR